MMLRKLILAFALGSLVAATTACNTVRGVGRDIESAADTVDKAT
jgi:entericidin B